MHVTKLCDKGSFIAYRISALTKHLNIKKRRIVHIP
jgi:hypothetical protein